MVFLTMFTVVIGVPKDVVVGSCVGILVEDITIELLKLFKPFKSSMSEVLKRMEIDAMKMAVMVKKSFIYRY